VKIERVAPAPAGLLSDSFEAFFELSEAPAALCDLTLRVVRANTAFEVLTGQRPLEGQRLTDFSRQALVVPEGDWANDVEVELTSGQKVTLTLSRRGEAVAVMARRLSPMVDSLAAAGRALIEQARIETQLLEIGRSVAGVTNEEALVATVARGVKGLFPGRTFCVRIADPRTCALTSLYAEGRLAEGQRDVFHLRRSMVVKTQLEVGRLPGDRVSITNGELPLLFQGSVKGIAVPLVASGQLFGALNVEYPAGFAGESLTDERVLIQLANQVAVAVRNAKLIDELSFMRKYLEELLEHANALILVANRDGRVVVFNEALSRLTGFAKSEVLGQDVARLVPEAERLRLLRMLDGALAGTQSVGQELHLSTSDGGERRVAFATSAVTSQAGEVEGVMCIGQDLTRTRELERRVIQAEKLASLGQLAASVVHEINNPMTAVATYADALLKRSVLSPRADPADVEKYRRIVENSERVLRFTPVTWSATRAPPKRSPRRSTSTPSSSEPLASATTCWRSTGSSSSATRASCPASWRSGRTCCRCSSTSSPTRATPRPRVGGWSSPPGAPTPSTPRWWSATPGWASRLSSSPASSSPSSPPNPTARAPGWGCPSCRPSSRATGARFRCAASWGAARASSFCCRCCARCGSRVSCMNCVTKNWSDCSAQRRLLDHLRSHS
jgi:two-component system NtrC family sensor kinase